MSMPRLTFNRRKTTPEGRAASTSGYFSHASTSGYRAPASTSGDVSPASTSGYLAPASTSGYFSNASTSGYRAPASSTGKGIALGLSPTAVVSGGPSACLAAAWWDVKSDRPRLVVGYVGEDGIEPHTWYFVENGKFVKLPPYRFPDYGLAAPK